MMAKAKAVSTHRIRYTLDETTYDCNEEAMTYDDAVQQLMDRLEISFPLSKGHIITIHSNEEAAPTRK